MEVGRRGWRGKRVLETSAGTQVSALAGGDTAVGWGSASRSPVIKVVNHGSEESRDVERVRWVLELVVDGAVHMVGTMFGGCEEIDAGAFVVGQVVAEGVGVNKRAAALPILGGGLGVNDQGVSGRDVLGCHPFCLSGGRW